MVDSGIYSDSEYLEKHPFYLGVFRLLFLSSIANVMAVSVGMIVIILGNSGTILVAVIVTLCTPDGYVK
jgi:hypothetical protein